jgi:hypothetical protein
MAIAATTTRPTITIPTQRFAISNKVLSRGVATLTIASHNLVVGQTFDVSGGNIGAPFVGTWVVASVPDATHITFKVATTPVYDSVNQKWVDTYPTDVTSAAATGNVDGHRQLVIAGNSEGGEVITTGNGAQTVGVSVEDFNAIAPAALTAGLVADGTP